VRQTVTIRAKITASLILAAVIPLVSAMFIAIRHSTDHSKARTINVVQSQLETESQSLLGFLHSRMSEIDTMAATPLLQSMDWNQIDPWLRARRETTSGIWEKFILGDPGGHFYNTAGGNPSAGGLRTFDDKDPSAKPKSIAQRDYWQQTVPLNLDASRKCTISDPMISYTTGAKQIVVASSVLRDDTVVGMIGGALPWDLFESRLSKSEVDLRTNLPDESAFALVAPGGVYWHHTDPQRVVRVDRTPDGKLRTDENGESVVHTTNILDENDESLSRAGQAMISGKAGYEIAAPEDSGPRYLFYQPIGDTGYSMLLEVPEGALMEGVSALQEDLFIVLLSTAPLAAIIAFFVARRLTTPIVSLAEVATAVTRGERRSLKVSGTAEIRQLTSAFSSLLQWLDESNKERDQAEQQRFDAVINQLPDALAMLSTDGRILHTNSPFDDLVDDASNTRWIWEVALWTGAEEDWRARLEDVKSGTLLFLCDNQLQDERCVYQFSMCSITQGDEQAIVLIGHDLTEREQHAALLAQAQQDAEASNRTKSEFLANMSHEIRTPLTAILGYTDVLREGAAGMRLSSEQSRATETIRRAGVHLLTVINDILDLSKIEAGKIDVETIETPLIELVLSTADLVRPHAEGKGLSLVSLLETETPDRVMSDPTRVRQILANLLSNAIKFTEEGGIELRISTREREGARVLRIEVEDSGCGMTAEQAERLFQPFVQADNSVTRKFGGTGLGLTISRRLATVIGGDVWLDESIPERGSRFVLELPLVEAPGATLVNDIHAFDRTPSIRLASSEETDPTLSGRILVAEDSSDNQRLIRFYLEKAGADISIAGNGRIALEMLDAAEAAGTPFDLLLSDMQMPEMDGYSLARELRARKSRIPIIALTADAMTEDMHNCIMAGCNEFASKPIDRHALLGICAKWLDHQDKRRLHKKAG